MRITLLLLFVFAAVTGWSQDSTKARPNRIFAFSIGAAMPAGQFAQSDNSRKGSGFARGGFQYNLEYASFWTAHTGFGIKGGHFTNGVNEQPFKDDQTLNWAPSLVPTGSTLVSATYTDIKNWKTSYILVGPYLTHSWGNFSLDFKFLGGMMYTTFPGYQLSLTTQTNPFQPYANNVLTTSPNRNMSFGVDIGLAGRIKTHGTAQVYFAVDFMKSYTKASYNYAYNGGGFGSQSNDAGSYAVNTVQVSWGVAFGSGRKH